MEQFTKSNWEALVIKAEKPVVVDFYADWCSPCKMMAPAFEKVAKAKPNILFGKLDVDASSDIAADARISSIPTLVFYKGGKEVKRVVGLQGEKDILEELGIFG